MNVVKLCPTIVMDVSHHQFATVPHSKVVEVLEGQLAPVYRHDCESNLAGK